MVVANLQRLDLSAKKCQYETPWWVVSQVLMHLMKSAFTICSSLFIAFLWQFWHALIIPPLNFLVKFYNFFFSNPLPFGIWTSSTSRIFIFLLKSFKTCYILFFKLWHRLPISSWSVVLSTRFHEKIAVFSAFHSLKSHLGIISWNSTIIPLSSWTSFDDLCNDLSVW